MNNKIVIGEIEKSNNETRVYDIYSRLLKDRIIIINGENFEKNQ